ncbi:DUF397 domain-containing protein [Streptomyces aidingensis]|uniref:DUF397 domain-containing protein n=1 Tax=Streptomyces aidingensis TaxID=910347 RepID=A0A1I1SIJ5_9ACTN|nr:DUF397 domain-containing protein [Streptomyces aidingensis]SFD43683.1 protein of unknown function [Streptomyces aidingensis]
MTADIDLTAAEWIASSYSASNGGQCVEVCVAFAHSGAVPVRDSKASRGPVLTFPPAGWAGFLSALHGGGLGTS